MKFISVVGARPNFIKLAPICKEFKRYPDVEHKILHTGQHYDDEMSKHFFEDLHIPEPDINLNTKKSGHTPQTAYMMVHIEKYIKKEKPDIVLVYGDVNSTLAAALVVSKMPHIRLGHIEAGCRCKDKDMPEEINRIITDHISDLLFVIDEYDYLHLRDEGINHDGVHVVGNPMADVIRIYEPHTTSTAPEGKFALCTIHRQSNVDDKRQLEYILELIREVSDKIPVIFPIHPRTEQRIYEYGLSHIIEYENIISPGPMEYYEFLSHLHNARFIMTDSGGVQVEAAILKTPCLTMRYETEHISTIRYGINELVGTNKKAIMDHVDLYIKPYKFPSYKNPMWDGRASQRIVDILVKELNQ